MRVNWSRRELLQMAGALALTPIFPNTGWARVPVLTGPTMGTRYRVHICQHPEIVYLPKLKHRIEQVLDSTDSLLAMLDSANSELAMVQISRGYNQIVETT